MPSFRGTSRCLRKPRDLHATLASTYTLLQSTTVPVPKFTGPCFFFSFPLIQWLSVSQYTLGLLSPGQCQYHEEPGPQTSKLR